MISIKAYSKKEMAQMYQVSPATFRNWAKKAFNAKEWQVYIKSKILNPKMVSHLFTHLGAPEN
jgi:transposase